MSATAGVTRARRVSRPQAVALATSYPRGDGASELAPAGVAVVRREVDLKPHEAAVVAAALAILDRQLREPAAVYAQPRALKDYLRLHLQGRDRECFGVMFLDAQHQLIAFEVLFVGTLKSTAVHPREVARRCLQLNADAVVLAHNHPSGTTEPSTADKLITAELRRVLQVVDVRVLDHIIVGADDAESFFEHGLI